MRATNGTATRLRTSLIFNRILLAKNRKKNKKKKSKNKKETRRKEGQLEL